MPAIWKTVRVFICSTFRDMQAERDHLVRFVFPRLREQLLSRRIHLVDVDLRWGVSSEQDAFDVCREIIDECRPRFLCILGGRYGWVPPGKSRSITADEVYYGVLDRLRNDRGFAYFYFRDDAVTAAMVETAPGEFLESPDSDNQKNLSALKQAIVAAGLNPFTYPAHWDTESRRLTGLQSFGDRVYRDLLSSIDAEFGTVALETLDEFAEENAAMEAFVEERRESFVLGSRETVLNDLLDHATATATATGGNGYVCLTGVPGSGKSAMIAYVYSRLTDSFPSSSGIPPLLIVIPHFVGASPGSTDVRRTLRRLCHELKMASTDITADIPDDLEKLRVAFPEFLRQACENKRVVILLDAVNQFDPTSGLSGFHWLPQELPDNARVILSMPDGSALEELRRRRNPPRQLELKPLKAQDGEAIIEQFSQRYHKNFEAERRAALLAKTDSGTPLYLLAALEELRTLGTYEEISQRIAELPPTTNELFAWILKRLENDDGFRHAAGQRVGRELVPRFAALLGASRNGLSQRELADLLDAGDPQGNVAALLYLLRPYLMRRGELLDFYHGQLRQAVFEQYGLQPEAANVHSDIATYFHEQDNYLESLEEQHARARRLPPSPRPVNRRKVEEMVYQRLNSLSATPTAAPEFDKACEKLEELLTDLPFLEAKTEAGLVFELLGDFTKAVSLLPEGRPRRRILTALGKLFSRHPLQFARSPRSICSQFFVDFIGQDELLDQLAERWRLVLRENRQTHVVRLNPRSSLRIIPEKLEIPFRSHVAGIECLPDSDTAVVYSLAGDLAVFDVRSRAILSETRIETQRLWSVASGYDSKLYCLAAGDQKLKVLGIPSLQRITELTLQAEAPRWVAFSKTAGVLAVGARDAIELISSSGEHVQTIPYPARQMVPVPYNTNMLVFDDEGRFLASACRSGDVLVFDLVRKEFLPKKGYCGQAVFSLAFESGRNVLWAGSLEGKLLRWNLDSGRMELRLAADDAVETLLWIKQEALLLSGHRSGVVRVWAEHESKPITVISMGGGWVRALAKPPLLESVIASSDDTFFLPVASNELRALELREINSLSACISVRQGEVIVASPDGAVSYFPSSNDGPRAVLPIAQVAVSLRQEQNPTETDEPAERVERPPWQRLERVAPTVVSASHSGRITYAGCSDGTLFGLNGQAHEIIFALLVEQYPITALCCDIDALKVVFASGRSLFGILLGKDGKIEVTGRIEFAHELKAYPLMMVLGSNHVLFDTGEATEYEASNVNARNSNLEIRRLDDLSLVSSMPSNTLFSNARFSARHQCIYAVEGDERFFQIVYSKLTDDTEFKVGRFARVGDRCYGIWRLDLASNGPVWEFVGKPKQVCKGHGASPVGLALSDDADCVSVLSRDGNFAAWDPQTGRLLHELQLQSKGLAGPEALGGPEFLCADTGHGSRGGPEVFHLRIELLD